MHRIWRVLPLAIALSSAGTAVQPAVAAQTAPLRATSTVTDVQLIAESRDQSIFSVMVTPRVGSFSTINTEPGKPTALLLRAARSSNLGSRKEFRGLVHAVEFEAADTGLAVRFNTGAPAKATAELSGPDRLLVTVTKLTGAEAIGSRPVASAGEELATAHSPPPAYDPMIGEDGYELVMLKYADVSEIVGLLSQGITVKPNNVFVRREPGFGSMTASSGTTYVAPNSQGNPDAQPLGEPVDAGMAVDRRLNAIWLKGSPERIARMKAQIAMIDVPVDSVIIETQFVELTEQGVRNLGIDFANTSGQIGVAAVNRGGPNIPFGEDPSKTLISGSVQAALYAQVLKGNGRIVSSPRIAAQSGQTAKILTGDALPILTSILSGLNAVSQQVQYVNVGVTLQIAPRVSPDGFVTSNIYAVVSSVTGFQQGYPTISQREAETSASVRDGETFVIGGLTIDNALTTRSKVPILGDIPLLGQAFRVDKANKSKTDLYIVITPHIVRHRRFGDFDQQSPAPPADIGRQPPVPVRVDPGPIPPSNR